MGLEFTHKPNYFLFAQLIIHHINNYVQKNPNDTKATFELENIYNLFQQDFASATTNLDGIMNIADEYKVETLNGDVKIIKQYQVDTQQGVLIVELNDAAVQSLLDSKQPIAPDATLHE